MDNLLYTAFLTRFTHLMRKHEKNRPLSKWRIEQFLCLWSRDFQLFLPFILNHYDEIHTLLCIALEHTQPRTFLNRTAYLLRNETLSTCFNYFEQIVAPLHFQKDDRAIRAIRASNQKVLSRWDTRTCLPDTAVASNVVAIKSPGNIEMFLNM